MRIRMTLFALVLVGAMLLVAPAAMAAITVTSIAPSGGDAGTTVQCTVRGTFYVPSFLYTVPRFFLNGPAYPDIEGTVDATTVTATSAQVSFVLPADAPAVWYALDARQTRILRSHPLPRFSSPRLPGKAHDILAQPVQCRGRRPRAHAASERRQFRRQLERTLERSGGRHHVQLGDEADGHHSRRQADHAGDCRGDRDERDRGYDQRSRDLHDHGSGAGPDLPQPHLRVGGLRQERRRAHGQRLQLPGRRTYPAQRRRESRHDLRQRLAADRAPDGGRHLHAHDARQ